MNKPETKRSCPAGLVLSDARLRAHAAYASAFPHLELLPPSCSYVFVLFHFLGLSHSPCLVMYARLLFSSCSCSIQCYCSFFFLILLLSITSFFFLLPLLSIIALHSPSLYYCSFFFLIFLLSIMSFFFLILLLSIMASSLIDLLLLSPSPSLCCPLFLQCARRLPSANMVSRLFFLLP